MRQTLRLGRVAGIPVGMHWSVLVIMFLLVQGLAFTVLPAAAPGSPWPVYLAAGIVAALLFLASLLAHELAHALVARYYRMRVERVTLWLLGGVAELGDEAPHPRADLYVAAAGPLASLGAAGLFGAGALAAGLSGYPPLVVAALAWLALINVLLALFNLLPGAPLDGGRVLRALLWRWRGDRDRANTIAARAGYLLGALLVAAGVAQILVTGAVDGLWLALVGWFVVSAAGAEQAVARSRALLGQVTVRSIMNAYPVCGYPDQSIEDFVHSTAARSGHRSFPLRDWYGRPAGVVRLADLGRVPIEEHASTPLSKVATPTTSVPVIDVRRPAVEVAPLVRRGAMGVVVCDGLLVGVVTMDDVARATEMAALGRRAA